MHRHSKLVSECDQEWREFLFFVLLALDLQKRSSGQEKTLNWLAASRIYIKNFFNLPVSFHEVLLSFLQHNTHYDELYDIKLSLALCENFSLLAK